MKNSRLARVLGLAALLEVLVSSCAATVPPMVEQSTAVALPTYLAQSPVAD